MISAHPLSWPEGWPRAKSRERANFGRTSSGTYGPRKQRLEVADGVNRVLLELGRLGIDRQDVIVSTNVRTRMDGLPRSGEAEPNDPGTAVYWVTHRRAKTSGPNPPMIEQRRVMAIDRYDRVADNLAAIAATLEALRAIDRHGGGQILERAFTGFTALPAPDAPRDWRVVLGVPGRPTLEDVEDAYRRLRSLHHPDRGGEAEDFHAVQVAYEQAHRELGLS